MRPRSSLFRILHALTALVTVWCLGCAALDPLISGLAAQPGAALMDCASEGGTVIATNVDQEPSLRAPASDAEQGAATCDCQSCLAPAPAALTEARVIPPVPDDPASNVSSPTSIERAPLVPPPQAVA